MLLPVSDVKMEPDVEYDDFWSNAVVSKEESPDYNQSGAGDEEYLIEHKNEGTLNQWWDYSRNAQLASFAPGEFINTLVRERISESISNDERHDRTHVNKLMVALWDKEDLANRTVKRVIRQPQQQYDGIDEGPRPLTPEKFAFMRGETWSFYGPYVP